MKGKPFKEGMYLNAWGKAFIAIKLCNSDLVKIRKMYKTRRGILRQRITKKRAEKWNKLWKDFKK